MRNIYKVIYDNNLNILKCDILEYDELNNRKKLSLQTYGLCVMGNYNMLFDINYNFDSLLNAGYATLREKIITYIRNEKLNYLFL